jgi:hypothetical protein
MESISLFRGIGKQLILCNFHSDVELRLCASMWTVCFSWVSVDRSARFQGGLEGGYRGAPRASGIGAGRGLIIVVVERSDRRRSRSAAAAAGAKVLRASAPSPLIPCWEISVSIPMGITYFQVLEYGEARTAWN